MEYLIGVGVTLAVIGLAVVVGFDRDRAFYPTILIVIASYYVLFAAMGSNSIRSNGMETSGYILVMEIAAAAVFQLFAVVGYQKSPWLVIVAMAGHGVFDLVHHFLIQNPGVPRWWPGFCLASDVTFALWLVIRRGKLAASRSPA